MVTNKQVKRLFTLQNMDMTKQEMADKANMDVKTAKKYLELQKLPSQVKPEHTWKTRKDPFEDVWLDIKGYLDNSGIESKTIFEYLQREHPGKFQDGQIRTLQRKVKNWKVTEGPNKEIFFDQNHYPGDLCESDFTDMNHLNITIAGQEFKHKLFHFILTYSNWETGTICFSESLESLSEGLQNAFWKLGGVPKKHRTDRLGAAINNNSNDKEFTQRYNQILKHYSIEGQKTQPYSPNENGDIEQRHFRYKNSIDQRLKLRGNRNFNSRKDYKYFLDELFDQLNSGRTDRLAEEKKILKQLPHRRIEDFKEFTARVSKGSTIRINSQTYSVQSRLIKEKVRVTLHADYLNVYLGHQFIERLPRIRGSKNSYIQYRHIIDSLLRKPGAFENYKYKSDMYPSSYFKMAYDMLTEKLLTKGNKEYLIILNLAAKESEELVNNALIELIDTSKEISFEAVETLVKSNTLENTLVDVNIPEVNLNSYDELLDFEEVIV